MAVEQTCSGFVEGHLDEGRTNTVRCGAAGHPWPAGCKGRIASLQREKRASGIAQLVKPVRAIQLDTMPQSVAM